MIVLTTRTCRGAAESVNTYRALQQKALNILSGGEP
jgi:hypothetical protein